MNLKIYPSKLKGEVRAPSSKSYAHRYIIASALANDCTEIIIPDLSEDIKATLKCVECLGAKVRIHGERVKITPIWGNLSKNRILDAVGSASTLRFLFPIVCALGVGATFIGDESLRNRPIIPLLSAIEGCSVTDGKLPLTVSGKMDGGIIKIPANISSQYVSGLLFALPLSDKGGEIVFTSPAVSKPYIDMTVATLESFNVKVTKTENGYKAEGGQKYVTPVNLEVENDWSNGAFFLVASVIGNMVRVKGLNPDSLQGDKIINEILLSLKSGGAVIDCTDIPDLLPPLVAAACYSTAKTEFIGAGRLRLKESDRLTAVATAFGAIGADIKVNEDGLTVYGKGGLSGGITDSFNDHRIAMSLAIASTCANAPVVIKNAECVSKSYERFFDDFKKLGGIYESV